MTTERVRSTTDEPAAVHRTRSQRPVTSSSLSPSTSAALQRSIGNRTTAALLAVAQRKLAVGPADDAYEREADAVADEVVARLSSGEATAGGIRPVGGEETDDAQRVVLRRHGDPSVGREGGVLDRDTEASISAARSGGRPLPGRTRAAMEGAFGADFGGVALHEGPESQALNHHVGAVAFTVGTDIFLGRSAPDVESSAGKRLLAHELTHTIQQGGAHVEDTEA